MKSGSGGNPRDAKYWLIPERPDIAPERALPDLIRRVNAILLAPEERR